MAATLGRKVMVGTHQKPRCPQVLHAALPLLAVLLRTKCSGKGCENCEICENVLINRLRACALFWEN